MVPRVADCARRRCELRRLRLLIVVFMGAALAGAVTGAQASTRHGAALPGRLLFATPAGLIESVRPDGTGARILGPLGAPDSESRLSPNHELVGFQMAGGGAVLVSTLSGTKSRQIAPSAVSWAWGPDSRHIAYSDGRQISVVGIDGKNARPITRTTRSR
jgi:hypothetical protein